MEEAVEANRRLMEKREAAREEGKGSISRASTSSMSLADLMKKIREKEETRGRSRPGELSCKGCGRRFQPEWDPFIRSWQYPKFDESTGICRRCKRLDYVKANIGECLSKAGVPPKYLACSFENFKPGKPLDQPFKLCKDYARDPSSSLFIYGSYGTGKTHMAVAIARELLLQGKKVVFTSVPRLLFEIRKAFQEDTRETEAVYIERYCSCEFLVLDDFGLEKATEWARQTMDYIIYQRDNLLKPMVVTSNLSLDEISQKIDGRIASRLAGMGRVVHFKGPDYRLSRPSLRSR